MTRKRRIHHEEVKDRHTTHWDLDLLSRAELERLMTQPSTPATAGASSPTMPTPDPAPEDPSRSGT